MSTIIIAAIVALMVAGAVVSLVRDGKKGCGGNCGNCINAVKSCRKK